MDSESAVVKRGEGFLKNDKGREMNTVCKVPARSQRNFQEFLLGKIEKVIVNAIISRDQPHEKVQTKRLR